MDRKPNEYWNYVNCKEEALKYNTKKDFRKNYRICYDFAYRNGWLNDICSHMIPPRKPSGYWTKERCKEEALKYNTRRVFQNNSKSAYLKAFKNKWLDDICSHMITQNIKPIGYWNDIIHCKEEALKYNSKGEFSKKATKAYDTARKNGWLDDICSHMRIIGNKYKRCIYAYEFEDNYVYIGLTHDIIERHKNRLNDKNDAVTIHINKTTLQPTFKQLTEYIGKEEAQKMEEFYKLQYKEKEWFILNRVKTGGLGGTKLKWIKEMCIEEALKYNTRNEFRLNSASAYYNSRKNNWLNDICSHMIEKNKPKGYWNFDRCKEVALKYNSRNELKHNSSSAYTKAIKNGWLDEICSHM